MTTFEDARVRWDRRYGEADALFGEAPNAWLAAHAHLLPAGARVLRIAAWDVAGTRLWESEFPAARLRTP